MTIKSQAILKVIAITQTHTSFLTWRRAPTLGQNEYLRNAPTVLVELHSGIPAATAHLEQQHLADQLERDLKTQDIPYLLVTSTSELSKYFRRPEDPIFVRYNNLYSDPSFIPLQKCTDLFSALRGEKIHHATLYLPRKLWSFQRHKWNQNPSAI